MLRPHLAVVLQPHINDEDYSEDELHVDRHVMETLKLAQQGRFSLYVDDGVLRTRCSDIAPAVPSYSTIDVLQALSRNQLLDNRSFSLALAKIMQWNIEASIMFTDLKNVLSDSAKSSANYRLAKQELDDDPNCAVIFDGMTGGGLPLKDILANGAAILFTLAGDDEISDAAILAVMEYWRNRVMTCPEQARSYPDDILSGLFVLVQRYVAAESQSLQARADTLCRQLMEIAKHVELPADGKAN